MGFPDSSVGTESTCNEGDLGSIPGLGRSILDVIPYGHGGGLLYLLLQFIIKKKKKKEIVR